MSGLFGIIDLNNRLDVRNLIHQMAETLSHKEWFVHDIYVNDKLNLGLGRVGIGVFNKSAQPAWSQSKKVAVFITGEIHNADSLLPRGNLQPVEQILVDLYESEGIGFIPRLNGAFCVAIFDLNLNKLFVFNDRSGLYPHYYHCSAGRFIFSAEIKGILCDSSVPKVLDWVALAQFVRFQRLLGTRTFFEDIHVLPYGSLLVLDINTGAMDVNHYWDFDQIPEWPANATFDDAVEETSRLLQEAVKRCLQGDYQLGVYLSGGLDSRTILGIASAVKPGILSLTYGVPNCWDAIYAQRIARKCKSPHYFISVENGKWIPDYVDFHLEMTEGFITWTHCHPSLSLTPAREILNVNLSGFNGDQVLGGRSLTYSPLVYYAPDDQAFLVHIFHYLNQFYAWPGVREGEERLLFNPDVFTKVQGLAFESLKKELTRFAQFPLQKRIEYFTAINQGARLTNMNEVFKRSYFEVRYPFCDNDFMDFVYSIPGEYRMNDKLYLAVVNKVIPELVWVPRASDHQYLINNKTLNTFAKYRHKIGQKIFKDQHPELHEDPEGWLRNDLQDWSKSVLFSDSMENHGIFNINFLRSLYQRHMAGHESYFVVGKIAPVMTYDLMLQRFFD